MYTRCPECQTVFRITREQLKARAGMVRCGRCRAVFQAERFLLDTLPDKRSRDGVTTGLSPQNPAAAEAAPEPAEVVPGSTGHGPENEKKRARRRAAAKTTRRSQAASVDHEAEQKRPRTGIPTVTDQEPALAPRTRTVFWLLGTLLLLALLAAQAVYFYRDELARYPALRPALEVLCRTLECRIETPRDASRIELLEATRVEPHPRYENALRIRVSMVNRAPFAQPYPWVELSLTDRAGNLIARRSFAPAEYLGRTPAPEEMLPVDVVKNVTLDVTDPDGKSAGYEIRLVHP